MLRVFTRRPAERQGDMRLMRQECGLSYGETSSNEARDTLRLMAAGYSPKQILDFLITLDLDKHRKERDFEREAQKRGLLPKPEPINPYAMSAAQQAQADMIRRAQPAPSPYSLFNAADGGDPL